MPAVITESTVEIEPESRASPISTKPVDDHLTDEQRKRDEKTTVLYEQFISAYKEKQRFAKKSKDLIFTWCTQCVSLLVWACVGSSVYVIGWTNRESTDIIALISAIIPLLVAVIGTLNIVTKHIFPEDEEKHITDIVKVILENDLHNKQENMKSTTSNTEPPS